MWLDALVGGSEAWEGPWASELVRREGGGGGEGRLLNVVCVRVRSRGFECLCADPGWSSQSHWRLARGSTYNVESSCTYVWRAALTVH